MDLDHLLRMYSKIDCDKVYVKSLAPNDNSKNQVYFGGSFEVLNILPVQEIVADDEIKAGAKVPRFKTKINFSWINNEGEIRRAPHSNLILYPDYPEVRFSGFLLGCKNAPSDLMNSEARIKDRLLFLGVTKDRQVVGYVVAPESALAKEFNALENLEEVGVFKALTVIKGRIELDSKGKLLEELRRIHSQGWINAKRFDRNGNYFPCKSSNCGGVTLETELGIFANSDATPDYLGWELKQFAVRNFFKIGSQPVTLMTPEPTDGFYADNGVEAFVREYGYPDKKGREARLNFGGMHKFGKIHGSTNLKLILEGYNERDEVIEDSGGFLGLIDANENIAAAWSFASLLKHWNTKHANACYVPSIKRKIDDEVYTQQYYYSNRIMLGWQTDFSIFLRQVAIGNIYYDPGIKLELAIENVRKQGHKARSQFRIKANNITNLYRENEIVDLLNMA